jgi:hypothetical protein
MAKNNKKGILKPVLIGSAIVGAGFLTYRYLIKPLINRESNDEENIQTPPALPIPAPQTTQVIQAVTQIPSGTAKFDPAKVLRPGAKSSLELQYSKRAFNSLIELSRKVLPTFVVKSQDDFNFKKRLETVSKLTLLDVNTEYGSGTKTVAKTILGVTDFTYQRVKSQKIAFYKRLGLPNPY